MEPSVLIALAALAVAGVTVVVFARRQAPPESSAAVDQLRSSVEELRGANATAMNDLRAELQRTLGATEQQLVTQTTATQRSLSDLSRQLGTLGEQSKQVGDLAKDIGSLQDLLRAPKARGDL